MPKVKRLPVHLANQIAAGEVVERPASVVKELVENALDAGATSIEIGLSGGGKRRIEVRDNGVGMSREDLELSVEPHATSKIETAEDLSRITTLGFRGEALASIGAVSRLSISSRQEGTSEGWRLDVAFGKMGKVRPQACPRGTVVSVEDLFLKTPARAKFLKSDQTEYARCIKVIHLFCAAWPEVDFKIKKEKKLVLSCKSGVSLKKRVEPLLGRQVTGALLAVSGKSEGLNINGFVSEPEKVRLSRRHLYFFLNRRPVSSPVLWKAANDALRGFLVKGNHPAGVLFLEIDPELVDVNVHPTKSEVRFERPNDIYRMVFHSLRRALENRDGVCLVSFQNEEVPEGKEGLLPPLTGPSKEKREVGETGERKGFFPLPWENDKKVAEQRPGYAAFQKEEAQTFGGDFKGADRTENSPRIIGQFANSFVIFELDEALFILDQHAAHEALIFKRLNTELSASGRLDSQQLLLPEVLDVDASKMENLKEAKRLLEKLGFEVEGFGENQVIVRAVPSSLFEREIDRGLVAEMVERALKELQLSEKEILRHLLERISCSNAIKAGSAMSGAEMDMLVNECLNEGVKNCPHGRPVMIRLGKEELYSRFFRK